MHYCSPTCSVLLPRHVRHCEAHQRKDWHSRQPAHRIRGRQLQELRLQLWERDPHCKGCGRLLLPDQMIRDHIHPLAEGGQDVHENTQGLCQSCSDVKTKAEQERGKARAR